MATKDLLKEGQNYIDLDLDKVADEAEQMPGEHGVCLCKETDHYGHFPMVDGEPMMGAEWNPAKVQTAEEADAAKDVKERVMPHAIIRFQNQREIEVVETMDELKAALKEGGLVEVHQLHVEIKRKFPTPVDTVVEKEITQVVQMVNPAFVQVVADVKERPVHTNNHAHMDAVTGPFSKM